MATRRIGLSGDDKNMIDENKGNYWYCKYCGSNKGTWFSRVIPMGNFCENCGKCADEDSDEFGQDLNRESIPNSAIDYDAIPEHIKKKAMEISNYFQEQGFKKWKLMGIQSRDFSDEQYYKPDSSRKIQ